MSIENPMKSLRESKKCVDYIWNESEYPLEYSNDHFLNILSDVGLYKSAPLKISSAVSLEKPVSTPRKKLHTTIGINDIRSIDPVLESFCVNFRLYLVFEVNLHEIGLSMIADKARESGHYYCLTPYEYDELCKIITIPIVSIFNQIDSNETDHADIRIYGGSEGSTAIMWNKQYNVICRQNFELQNFPFDTHTLKIELRLNDSKTWDIYDLCVNIVQFHVTSLSNPEWYICIPSIHRDSPKEKVTQVFLKIDRKTGYYLQNVVAILFTLSVLGLVIFAMDIHDLGSRVSTLLTLLLTSVAFKFILASSIPKVPYSTLMDYYIMFSMASIAIMTSFSIIPSLIQDENQAILINQILAIFSVISLIVTLIGWLITAQLKKRYTNQLHQIQKIMIVKDKNWYNFRYSNPKYLVK